MSNIIIAIIAFLFLRTIFSKKKRRQSTEPTEQENQIPNGDAPTSDPLEQQSAEPLDFEIPHIEGAPESEKLDTEGGFVEDNTIEPIESKEGADGVFREEMAPDSRAIELEEQREEREGYEAYREGRRRIDDEIQAAERASYEASISGESARPRRPRFTAEEMRKAVAYSIILDKPKALQRRQKHV